MSNTDAVNRVVSRLVLESYENSDTTSLLRTTDLLHFIQHSDQSTQYSRRMLEIAITKIVFMVDSHLWPVFGGLNLNEPYSDVLYRCSKYELLYG